jgi:DNA-binding MarR family transcriptional regulator
MFARVPAMFYRPKARLKRVEMSDGSQSAGKISLGRLSDVLGFRLRRVQNQLSRDFSARIRPWNMRAGMFSALEIISANPSISQAELSLEVGLDKSAMVQIVDDLESRGWVVRTRSKSDRRRNDLTITEEGKVQLDQMVEELARVEEAGLAMLTVEEQRLVNAALDKVYQAYVKGG